MLEELGLHSELAFKGRQKGLTWCGCLKSVVKFSETNALILVVNPTQNQKIINDWNPGKLVNF